MTLKIKQINLLARISNFYDNPEEAVRVLNEATKKYGIFLDGTFADEEKEMYEKRQKCGARGTVGILENHIEYSLGVGTRKSQSRPGHSKGKTPTLAFRDRRGY